MNVLTNQTILITGGATGIGRALALALAARGNDVIVCGRRADKLEQIARLDPRIRTIQADVTQAADRERLFREAARGGTVDVLVNNAAVFHTILDIERDFTEQQVNRVLQTNVLAPLALMRRFLDQAPASGGRVINIGSIAAWLSIDSQAVYAATKAALHSFTRSARPLLGARGITVHEVMTPAVDTDMTAGIQTRKMTAEQLAQVVIRQIARGREEIRVGPDARLAWLGSRFFPGLLDRIVRKRLEYDHAALPG